MKRKRIVKKTRAQLERAAHDPCLECYRASEYGVYEACCDCPHRDRAFPKLTPEQGGLDDVEQLSRDMDTMLF